MADTILIAEKYRGPPNSGNGGYVSGVIASALTSGIHNSLSGSVEVTLRAPTPLDRPLTLYRHGDGLVVRDADILIAEARTATFDIDVPTPATWNEATLVREQSYSFPIGINTLFPTPRRGVHPICFCCGAELLPADGAHVYSAPLRSKQQVAAAWVPNEALANTNGVVGAEHVWTALDCPGQMAWRAEGIHTGMLGRITARIERSVRAGERCVVIGWTLGSEGKKYFAGTALFNEAGELCAAAKAVWIGKVN